MPRIFITQPFLHHCAGSIFDLSDEIGIAGWNENDMVVDIHDVKKNYCYNLPDDGKGKTVELLLTSTAQCAEAIFNSIDLKNGPCRITSVSKDLEAKDDPYYADPLPKGRGKITYDEQENVSFKNRMTIDMKYIVFPDEMIVLNKVTKDMRSYGITPSDKINLDFTDYSPGFYKVYLNKAMQPLHHFTMIKCFPIVLDLDPVNKEYSVNKTLW